MRQEVTAWLTSRFNAHWADVLPGGWMLCRVDPDGTPPASPYAVFNVISRTERQTTEAAHTERVYVQIDIYGPNYPAIVAAREEILRGDYGLLNVAQETITGGVVMTVAPAGSSLTIEDRPGTNAERIYRERVDVLVLVSR